MRLQLIECATTRPDDITAFYNKYLVTESNGCTILNGPLHIDLFYRGHLRKYNASLVPFALAGVDPNGPKSCHNPKCVNPDHVL
jgi:hypothetical protein